MRQKLKDYNKELFDIYNKYFTLRNCGNADHLTNKDGTFKPTTIKTPGQVSFLYLEEACQWLFYRKDLDYYEKMKKILTIESIIEKLLNPIKYVPYWSHKLTLSYKIDI